MAGQSERNTPLLSEMDETGGGSRQLNSSAHPGSTNEVDDLSAWHIASSDLEYGERIGSGQLNY